MVAGVLQPLIAHSDTQIEDDGNNGNGNDQSDDHGHDAQQADRQGDGSG